MPEFAPVIDVSTLNGTNGFRLDGDAALDHSGRPVAGGGDINGDGFADLLIGAPPTDTGGTDRGFAWVVFGAASTPAVQGLQARVSAGTAYRFQGEAAGNLAGYSVRSAGDVNGDGFDDLLIGAHQADPDAVGGNRGATYLVFGGAEKLSQFDNADESDPGDHNILLGLITASTGFRFDGVVNGDVSGFSVSGAGDFNGDGIADLIIGAPYATTEGSSGAQNGTAYIVFGGSANLNTLDGEDGASDGRIDLANLSTGQGLRLDRTAGEANAHMGFSVAPAGDVNGDGLADVLVGVPGALGKGVAHVVFGRPQSQITSDTLDLAFPTGFEASRFDGATGDGAARSINGLGDVNGDGFDDFVIGAFARNSARGAAYVVFGKSAFDVLNDLSGLNGSNGFRLNGLRANDDTGFSVSAAGDVNGDGFADILVGADGFDHIGAGGSGAAYVVFGKALGFTASIDLGSLNGDTGFRIEGAAGSDHLGTSVEAAGDVNGDGFDDLIVGAPEASNNGLFYSGSTYVIYGHRANTAVTRIGTALDNAINGGKGDDTISGLSGNDTLFGWENDDEIKGGDGADSINAGEGDDTVRSGGGSDKVIVAGGDDELRGGSGIDTLSFENINNPVTVNLVNGKATLSNGDVQTLFSFENVIGGGGADTLTGNAKDNTLDGRGGNDTIAGGDGDDTITGSAGQDQLNGNAGLDRFTYGAVGDLGTTGATRDIIIGFGDGDDLINVTGIDARTGAGNGGDQDFTFDNTFGIGDIRATQSGADTLIEFNTDSDAAAEMSILVKNFTATNFSGSDFIL